MKSDRELLELAAKEAWNNLADQYNQWSELGADEREELIAQQRAAALTRS